MTPRSPLSVWRALVLTAVVSAGAAFAGEAGETAAPAETDAIFKPLPPAAPIKLGKKKAAVGKKKAYDYGRSKYKSRELSENSARSYRFNEKGEPISGDAKKKAASKRKKRSEPLGIPEDEVKGKTGACSSEENCAEKNIEADAL